MVMNPLTQSKQCKCEHILHPQKRVKTDTHENKHMTSKLIMTPQKLGYPQKESLPIPIWTYAKLNSNFNFNLI